MPAPSAAAEILAARTVRTASDHLAVWAKLQIGAAVAVVETINIRATPPMFAKNVKLCIALAASVSGVSVIGFQEMGGRNLAALVAPLGWVALQGEAGNEARAPIAYDPKVWDLEEWHVERFSTRIVQTKIGPVSVPSGDRDATIATLRHRATDVPVTFVCFHGIAHMNVGARFGWTGKGSLVNLKARLGAAGNPAVTVFQRGMASLEARVLAERAAGRYVVPMGDWNFNVLAEMKVKDPEPTGVLRTMQRAGVETVYSAKRLTTGTAGTRGIDVIGVAVPIERTSA